MITASDGKKYDVVCYSLEFYHGRGATGLGKETGIVDVVKTGAADVLRVTGTLSLNVQES